jgi:hypothetical protein
MTPQEKEILNNGEPIPQFLHDRMLLFMQGGPSDWFDIISLHLLEYRYDAKLKQWFPLYKSISAMLRAHPECNRKQLDRAKLHIIRRRQVLWFEFNTGRPIGEMSHAQWAEAMHEYEIRNPIED